MTHSARPFADETHQSQVYCATPFTLASTLLNIYLCAIYRITPMPKAVPALLNKSDGRAIGEMSRHISRTRNDAAIVGPMLGIAIICMLAGCATGPSAPPYEAAKVVPGGVAVSEPYRLTPGDDLYVRFPYDKDLNDEVVVSPDGTVTLQYVNDIKLAGLSLPEARDVLDTEFGKVLREPTVSVSVKSYSLQQIYVSGQVNNPGLVRDTVPLTLSRAIAEAGGLKLASAITSQVLIVRRRPDGTIVYYQVDMSNGVVGTDADPLLSSYDLVYVPETQIAQLADFISNNLVRTVPYSFATQYTP
jgi:protein involved in polysaccharide export with SLBB domain